MRKHVPVPVPPGCKYCHKCAEVRPVAEFHRARSKPDGLTANCKPCTRAARQEAAAIQRLLEEVLAESAEYRRHNPLPPYEPPIRPMSVPNP